MPSIDFSRRAFLTASGGAALLAACGGSSGSSAKTAGTAPLTEPGSKSAKSNGLQGLRVSSDLYQSPDPQRFAFVLTKHNKFYAGPPATISFTPKGGHPGAPIAATFRADGLPENRGIYTVDTVFATPSVYTAAIDVAGEPTKLFVDIQGRPNALIAGEPAIPASTPTLTDNMGVDPICTRDPVCSLHTQSLDALIAKKRPLAVLFATPARCQTRFCGPVLDQVLALVPQYQDRIDFVHIEIYAGSQSDALIPAVEAWGLQSEPWLFGVNNAGVITQRLDGAFATSEVTALLNGLLA